MRYWTWAEVKAKIQADLDLEDEDFVRPAELLGYANEAIDEAEAEIHTLYQEYFLKSVAIPVAGGNGITIAIPTYLPDIYGDKFRDLEYLRGDGTTSYRVSRLRDWHKFQEKAVADANVISGLYRWMTDNPTPGNPRILLVGSDVAGTLTVWYYRNANRLVLDTDVCDIPEFINFIFAHMKMKVYAKEGHPSYADALERLETERQRMVGTLAERIPDNENEIEMDSSHYEDMV